MAEESHPLAPLAQVAYNPFEPGFAENPYPQLAALRRDDPVHESPLGIWVLTRYDDVQRFLRDPTLSVDEHNAGPRPMEELVREIVGDRAERGSYAMLNRDPPDHTRLRKLVSKAFTPRTVEQLRPHLQDLVDEALDKAAAQGELELIGDLAFPLPFVVISELLGVPDTDRDQLREWSGLMVQTLEPLFDLELIRQIADASEQMRVFLLDVITWKRREPSDDLLSRMIAAREPAAPPPGGRAGMSNEDGDMLSDEELLEQVMLLYIAGHETTVNLIGNGTLALLRHPEQLARLRDDPSLDANAIEELLRYDSPVQMSRRITLQDVQVRGKTIPKGTFVPVSLASANRDEDHWGPQADDLDLGRGNAHEHLSFGGGAHYCLGAALARLEGQVAIGSLVRRFPALAIAGDPVWNGRLNLRGLDRLPLALSRQ
ncbi:MAG: cytochrome P450 [Acidimicrobiales bacterium]